MPKPPKLKSYQKQINERRTNYLHDCPCIACGGSGYYDVKNSPKCSACNGTGKNGKDGFDKETYLKLSGVNEK